MHECRYHICMYAIPNIYFLWCYHIVSFACGILWICRYIYNYIYIYLLDLIGWGHVEHAVRKRVYLIPSSSPFFCENSLLFGDLQRWKQTFWYYIVYYIYIIYIILIYVLYLYSYISYITSTRYLSLFKKSSADQENLAIALGKLWAFCHLKIAWTIGGFLWIWFSSTSLFSAANKKPTLWTSWNRIWY